MREFKIGENEKTQILEELNKELDRFQERLEYADDVDEQQEFQTQIDILKQEQEKVQEGKVSQRLFRLINTDVEIALTPEMHEILMQDLSGAEDKEYFENKINAESVEWTIIAKIYAGQNVLANNYLEIDKRTAEILLQMKKNDSVSWEKSNRDREELIEKDIKQGKIKYEDFLHVINDFSIEDREECDRFIQETMYKYNKGIITQEELLKTIASPSNKSLESYMEKYNKNKRNILVNSANGIFEASQKLQEYGFSLSDEQQQNFNKILGTINPQEIGNKSTEELEAFVDLYNEFANEVWKEYLDGKDKFLIHVTKFGEKEGIVGEFKDKNISTSLISLSSGLKQIYINSGIGYQIKPKHIVKADSQDVYLLNTKEDRYAASGLHKRIDVKLPQLVEKETLEKAEIDKKTISEVVADDFEIEAVVLLAGGDTLEIAENFSKNQNGIPIKIATPNGLITLEEARELDMRNDFKESVMKSVTSISENKDKVIEQQKELREKYKILGLKDNLTDYSEMIKLSDELVQDMQHVDIKSATQEKTDLLYENMWQTNDIYGTIAAKENEKYTDAISEKVNLLISKAKKSNLENEKAHIQERKVGFVQRLFGGNKLKEAQIRNIELREKLVKPEDKKYNGFQEIAAALLECTKETGLTPEISEFIENYSKIEGIKDIKQRNAINEIMQQPHVSETKALEPTIGITKISEETNKVLARNVELEGRVQEARVNSNQELCEKLEKNSPMSKLREFAEKTRDILEIDSKENLDRNKEKQNDDKML